MGVSVVSALSTDVTGAGTHTFAFDAGAGTNYIVVLLSGNVNWASAPGDVKWDGVTLTALADARGPGDRYVKVYALVGATVASGEHDVSVAVNGNESLYARVYAGVTDGTPAIGDYDATYAASGAARVSLDSVPSSRGFAVVSHTGTQTGLDGFTVDESIAGGYQFGHETDEATGERWIGWTGNSIWAVGGVLIEDGTTIIEPDAVGMEWGVVSPGPTLTVSEDVTNYAMAVGMEWGVVLPGPRVAPSGPRQVMLTGEGVKTPEMTVGGTEGQVLTFHPKSPPTWEDAGAGASALDDLTDVDAATPDDGDVLAWSDGDSAWVPVPAGAPDLSAAVLDDIGDVDAPAPNDGDVLTYDDYAGEWVATAPVSGASALDDLTDVDAPAPNDGDVLAWDDTEGEWVPAAAAGGDCPVDELLTLTGDMVYRGEGYTAGNKALSSLGATDNRSGQCIDGNNGSYIELWGGNYDITLDREYLISSVRNLWYPGYAGSARDLYYSINGTDWTHVFEMAFKANDETFTLETPITARYWRIAYTSGYGCCYTHMLISEEVTGPLVRLPIGDDGDVLTVVDGIPAWVTP